MQLLVFVLLVATAALALPQSGGNRRYTDKYDHVDVDAILKNERILNSYIKCMLDQGPCTAEGRELKTDLPDALETECAKCTPSQKNIVRKAARFLSEKRPQEWQRLTDRFDPEGKFKTGFERFLNDTFNLTGILPDALATDCASCSDTQKNGSTKVIHYLIENKESIWTELAGRYDPSGAYRTRHPEIFERTK
ncbi:hypothetical protein B566_EDAN016075 [Ephemera danica]|nr:hypothetical protein B566_EDAN016075 [Ephemera danica]